MNPAAPCWVERCNSGCVGIDALLHCNFGVIFFNVGQEQHMNVGLSKILQASLLDVLCIPLHLYHTNNQNSKFEGNRLSQLIM